MSVGSFRKLGPFRFPYLMDIVKFLILIGAITWLMARGTNRLGYNWQWYRIPQYIFSFENGQFLPGPLLEGLMVTLRITGWSLALAFALGLGAALLRLSGSFVATAAARAYMECIRNTPLLVQLFFIYFVLGPILDISRFTSAVLALSLFEGAYASEIFRAGIVSIHAGQWEAAHSLGLSTCDTYRYVILPQAVRRILPPLTSQAISLIKDSALVSTIAIYDLTMRGQEIVAETYLAFEVWFTVAAIYLLITVTLSTVVHMLETRIMIHH
ncbi:MAG: amino acid ABC transporter permease [Deltaproteobacteria bacterium]|nr:amino acid ABC transporter permease [Deltaproteobacteria bacterium]